MRGSAHSLPARPEVGAGLSLGHAGVGRSQVVYRQGGLGRGRRILSRACCGWACAVYHHSLTPLLPEVPPRSPARQTVLVLSFEPGVFLK